ncbi:apolipoprotein N-acyltransferase [Telmatobacter bradus]|uniref:apolipoprotein N-acyltransferase n=1 Tax=Telmatobacter bradus TaxID=474953 RepID=UPI003B42C63B
MAALVSAGLLELPFPLAGPMPVWRSIFAWFGLAPLLWAILSAVPTAKNPLRRGFCLGYIAGVLWYMGNCYWVRDTMMQYGDMPPFAPELLLIAFGLYLGTYVGLFGLGLAWIRRRTGSAQWTLLAAPFLWTALDLAAAHITSDPWDQLGYSQVDNQLINRLATLTGVYGISFLLVVVNALLAGFFLLPARRERLIALSSAALLTAASLLGLCLNPAPAPSTATAVLVQPNLDVTGVGLWNRPGEWEAHAKRFAQLAASQCKTYIAGMPESGAPTGEIVCPPYATHPDLVAWPESPAPFFEDDHRFQKLYSSIGKNVQAASVIGAIGVELEKGSEGTNLHEYNSALIVDASGNRVGRYDKIHLVPFGEYVPFQQLLVFARKLTGQVSRFDRGTTHKTFVLDGHSYGVFICYESVFADEVREFAAHGAEVLVNISDDGWYGDTSAPWQHLNMARMRAIENRRWILRDTNSGVTAAIDPYGRVRQSIPRHTEDALPAQYGFRHDVTFYSAHGDLFAGLCVLLSLGLLGYKPRRPGKMVPVAR